MNPSLLALRTHQREASRLGAAALRGRPAHNRLPGDTGAFNDLYWRYAHRAKRAGIPFELSKGEFRELTSAPCCYCGAEPSSEWRRRKGAALPYRFNGIDQKHPGLGYTALNSATCCAPCNYMKQDSTLEQFFERVRAIHDHCGLGVRS